MSIYKVLLNSIWSLIDQIELKQKYLFIIYQDKIEDGMIGIDVLDWETEDATGEGGWFKVEEVQNYLLGFRD